MKTTAVSFTEAKTHLARYGRLAEAGQTILVCRHRRAAFAIAALPRSDQARPKTPGLARGRIHIEPDFDNTPEDIIRDFEGAP